MGDNISNSRVLFVIRHNIFCVVRENLFPIAAVWDEQISVYTHLIV